jgi:hypothetical protein
MWSEEELREIEPMPRSPRTLPLSCAASLRARIAALNRAYCASRPHELSRGASPVVIYTPCGDAHGNFIDESYRAIVANLAWSARLRKAHTSKRMARPTGPDEVIRQWCELDSANSSDALLMNIFCFPEVLAGPKLTSLLGIEPNTEPVFGYPARVPLTRNRFDRTSIDLRLGHLLIEAKLTENDFTFAPLKLIEDYAAFDRVFDRDLLDLTPRGVRSYQLIRGVLAAASDPDKHFCVLTDARRPDLMEAWYAIMRAVHSYQLQAQLRLLTWQELVPALPSKLAAFLEQKYGITA